MHDCLLRLGGLYAITNRAAEIFDATASAAASATYALSRQTFASEGGSCARAPPIAPVFYHFRACFYTVGVFVEKMLAVCFASLHGARKLSGKFNYASCCINDIVNYSTK